MVVDEREWVPVAILWDEDLRPQRRDVDRLWAEEEADLLGWPPLEEIERDVDQLSKRRRKKLRGDARERER